MVAERPAAREAPVEVDSRFEFFPTPAAVVARMIEVAYLKLGMDVLEPSAGRGAIAGAVAALGCNVDCIEIDERNARALDTLECLPRQVTCAHFLAVGPAHEYYDRVLMNPPFGNGADVRHALHAERFLRRGGLLVAVMSGGAEFRSDKRAEQFRKLVADRGGWIEDLPEEAFKLSGTSVRTVLAVLPAAM